MGGNFAAPVVAPVVASAASAIQAAPVVASAAPAVQAAPVVKYYDNLLGVGNLNVKKVITIRGGSDSNMFTGLVTVHIL